jgi:hypothetical protein
MHLMLVTSFLLLVHPVVCFVMIHIMLQGASAGLAFTMAALTPSTGLNTDTPETPGWMSPIVWSG